MDDRSALVGDSGSLRVAEAEDVVPRGDVQRIVPIEGQAHRRVGPLEKRRDAIGVARVLGVFEHPDAIGFRPL